MLTLATSILNGRLPNDWGIMVTVKDVYSFYYLTIRKEVKNKWT